MGKLECIVLLELAFMFVSFKARASFDVARDISIAGPFQEIRLSDQIAFSQTPTVYEGLATINSGTSPSFAIGQIDPFQICRDWESLSNCLLVYETLFPESSTTAEVSSRLPASAKASMCTLCGQ